MNRIIPHAIVLLIGLALVSCKTGPKGQNSQQPDQNQVAAIPAGPVHLNMPDLIGKSRPIFLSDLADSVAYVPLETTDAFLIGEQSVRIKPCGAYFFVSEHGKPIGVFDRTGKFIRKIGAIGKGPGEYNFDFTFWPEVSSRQVYVWNADARSIMAFTFEGKFVKNIVPEIEPMAFVPVGNNHFFSWTFMQKELSGHFFRMIIHDDAGQTISRIDEPKKRYDFSKGVSIMTPLLTPCSDGVLYNSWEVDTIFKITADNAFKPAIIWEPGKLKMPPEILNEYERFRREGPNYLIDFNAYESKSAWFISYEYKNRHEMAIYQKLQQSFFVVANPDTAGKGIFNDIDGGPSFFPTLDNENGCTFVRLIHTIDLIEPQNKPIKNKIPPKNPAAAEKFRSMVSGLNENSNPVVMLVQMR